MTGVSAGTKQSISETCSQESPNVSTTLSLTSAITVFARFAEVTPSQTELPSETNPASLGGVQRICSTSIGQASSSRPASQALWMPTSQ